MGVSMRRGNLFVISGPSGAGKGTLVQMVLPRVADAWLSVSATTRQPREGEVDGVHYQFLGEDEFSRLIDEDGLLEWACVHGCHYGTPKSTVLEHMNAGDQVILEIDVQGALQVKEIIPEAHLVFIAPPSMEELERRLRGRGTETEEKIALRMGNARHEMELRPKYDVCLTNDNLDECADALLAYIENKALETRY